MIPDQNASYTHVSVRDHETPFGDLEGDRRRAAASGPGYIEGLRVDVGGVIAVAEADSTCVQ
jgi:hypothetical protein